MKKGQVKIKEPFETIEIKSVYQYQPTKVSEGAACIDLVYSDRIPLNIQPFQRVLVPTGMHVEIPKGYIGLIHTRECMAYASGVIVLNAPQIISSDERKEIKVLLCNLSSKPYNIIHRQRIAYLRISKEYDLKIIKVEALNPSEREHGGFK